MLQHNKNSNKSNTIKKLLNKPPKSKNCQTPSLICMNSGGASSQHATTTGGAWVQAPPQDSPKNKGSGTVCSPLPFCTGGDLQNKKNASKVLVPSPFFSDLFLPIPFSDLQIFSFFYGFRLLLLCFGYSCQQGGGVGSGCGSTGGAAASQLQ